MSYRVLGSLVFVLATAANAQAGGERVALCVGVNDYDQKGFEKPKYAERDAAHFATALRNAGYRVVLMTGATGRVLDPKLTPTKENIQSQLAALLAKRERDDLVIVALAGRGFEFDKDPDTYFCPVDAVPHADRKGTLISLDGVYKQLGQSGAGTNVLLADCCRTDPNPARSRGPGDTLEKVPPKGVLALYACQPNQRSYESDRLHQGVFFHHVLEGMRGKAGQAGQKLVFEELVAHVRKEVPETVKALAGATRSQIPVQKGLPPDGAAGVLLTAADRKVLQDASDLDRWYVTRGSSSGYYREKAGSRVADWKVAAEGGSARAMLLYGRCLESGFAVKKEVEEAVKWYRKATELGEPRAMIHLGACYHAGTGVKTDAIEAVKWFRKGAELDDPQAMVNLGMCYADGTGVKKDEVEAVKWYRKAAELGETQAMHNLGECYLEGMGVKKDETEAVKWYRKAAELGNLEAMFSLGVCYADGIGVKKDAVEAVKWYRKGAELEHPEAMFSLGVCYAGGTGVKKDETEAVKWYRKATELNQPMAMVNLGSCYLEGTGVKKDAVEAVKWYRKGAELNQPMAMNKLGGCYANGTGVKKDEDEAVKWFRMAAKLEHPGAMFYLGACYYNGVGVKKDEDEAVKWFRMAAKLEHPGAMFYLGACYYNGVGVKKDEDEAVKWFRMAAKLGNEDAKDALKKLGE